MLSYFFDLGQTMNITELRNALNDLLSKGVDGKTPVTIQIFDGEGFSWTEELMDIVLAHGRYVSDISPKMAVGPRLEAVQLLLHNDADLDEMQLKIVEMLRKDDK